MKPILFLDIDGTLLREPTFITSTCSPDAPEFIRWAKKHFEVRWLTAWASDFPMSIPDCRKLIEFHGVKLSLTELTEIPTQLWIEHKFDSVDETELQNRPFVWLDDSPRYEDIVWLVKRQWSDRHIQVRITQDPDALKKAKETLIKMFNIIEEN